MDQKTETLQILQQIGSHRTLKHQYKMCKNHVKQYREGNRGTDCIKVLNKRRKNNKIQVAIFYLSSV